MFRIHYGVTVTATRHYNVLYVGETFRKVREGCMYYRNIFIEFPSLEVIMSSWCHPKSTDDQLLTVSTISRLVKSISLYCPYLVESAPALRFPRVEMTQTMAELGRVLVVMTMALLLTLRPRCH